MKRVFVLTAVILLTGIFTGQTAGAGQFGNMAIYLDSAVTEDFSRMGIQLQGEPMLRFFDNNPKVIFWNIQPGRYEVQLAFPDDRKSVSVKIDVYPGLTSKLHIIPGGESYVLVDDGFLDQGGHMLAFDRDGINSLPGELSDGLGILSSAGRDSVLYSYEGLGFIDPSRGRAFTPSSKSMPDLALVNISDPFAGFGGADVSLISNYSGPEKIGGDYTYGSRDQRLYRVVAKHALPRDVGYAFGALSFENLGDADPKWNVDSRLPHNGAENVELMGGAGFDILSRFKSNLNIYYKSVKRDYYDHAYYFNTEHAPREESYIYSGDFSIYGNLRDDLFINAGFGIAGDDSKTGDGVLFDDVAAYEREYSYPGSDYHNIFYSWDDLNGVTEDIDEAHYYDGYDRYKSSTTGGFLKLKKQIEDRFEIWTEFTYSKSIFRKYTHYDENIGFDSLGDETTDNNYFADIPNPTWFAASLGGNLLEEKYFLKGAVDFQLFDPGTLTFRDFGNPLDPDETGDYSLDESDMTDADVKTNIGFRAAAGLSLNKSFGLFGNGSISYEYPSYDLLYLGYEFFEDRISYGSSYPYSNPELDPVQYTKLELGINGRYGDVENAVSYQYHKTGDLIGIYHISEFPYSYDMLGSTNEKNTDHAIVFSCRWSGNHLFSGSIAGEVVWRDNYISMADYNIAWISSGGGSSSKLDFTTYRLSGAVGINPNALDLDRDKMFGKVLSRLSMNVSFNYKSGFRYTTLRPYPAASFYYAQVQPTSAFGAEKAKDFFEINLAVTARVADFRGARMSLSFEVLNLFDRDNYLDVYGATGEADYDGYDQTAEYDAITNSPDGQPQDNSGLSYAEKYTLKLNDPNNYYRPRMFRVLARLEF